MLVDYYDNEKSGIDTLLEELVVNKNFDYMDAGEPLIVLLAKYNKVIELNQMLAFGCDVNKTSMNKYTKGNSALIEASLRGNREIVEGLLAHNADPNLKNYMGNTALMMAVLNKQVDIIRILIDYGADVNCLDNNRISPLMYASGKGYFEICELLIEVGANVEHIDDDGDTALKLAYQHRDFQLVQLLKN